MITALESRILDANSEASGVSIEQLMLNAGKSLASFIRKEAEGKVLIICGSGNNGGDGYASHRFLTGVNHTLCRFREPKSPLCRKMAENLNTVSFDDVDLNEYGTIVDCVLGTGPSVELRDEYKEYVRMINSSGKRIISCDVPTGFGTSSSIIPYATVTFHEMKEGMDENNCGRIVISDIGIPLEATTVVNKGDLLRYPIPKADSHKGQNGRLLIIGGGPYVGAPIMAAMASLRIGVDLVTVATPAASFIPIAAYSPAYMVRRLSGDVLSPEDCDDIIGMCQKVDAILIGPGLGTDERTKKAVLTILDGTDIPAVVDADAITAVSGSLPKRKDTVYTPHRMELRRLSGKDDPSDEDVTALCRNNGCVILRKGETDRIYSSETMRMNRSGSPGMTVGGTGDVLAGIVAGLLAKGMDAFDAACLGAYISGKAGEKAFDRHSFGMTATDVIDNIGTILKEGIE